MGWTVLTTFEAPTDKAVARLSLDGLNQRSVTLRQVLEEFAAANGARLEIGGSTIAFLNE